MNEKVWILKWMFMILAFFMLPFDTVIVIGLMCMGK